MSSRKRSKGKRKEGGRIKSFKNSLIIHKETTKEISIKWVSLYLIKTRLKLTFDTFFRPLAHCAVSLIYDLYTNKSGRLREHKNKGEVQLGNPKRGRGRLREIFITKLKSKFQRGITKVVVTWAGRLRGWLWRELWLYYTAFSVSLTLKSITQPAISNCRINFGTVCSSFPALRMATCSLPVSEIHKYFNSLGVTCIGYVLYHSSLRTPVRSEIGLGKIHISAWNKVKFHKAFGTPLLEFSPSLSPPPLRQQTKTLQIPPFLACFIHRVTPVLLRALQHTWTQDHKFVSGTQRSSGHLIVFPFRSVFRVIFST